MRHPAPGLLGAPRGFFRVQGYGFRVQGFRGLGFRGLGFRGLGFRGLGFRGLGFRVMWGFRALPRACGDWGLLEGYSSLNSGAFWGPF